MKLSHLFISGLSIVVFATACKNETQNEGVQTSSIEKSNETVKNIESSSLMVKLMKTKEASTFTRSFVTAGITGLLTDMDGEYTVLAPSEAAFKNLPKQTLNFYLTPENKTNLSTLLKNHIVEGNLSSADLLQTIRKNGDQELTTLGGESVTASLKDGTIVLKDAKGKLAVIGKSDIMAGNGVLHVIDGVLNTSIK